jgi:hypothetical protein
MSERQDCQLSQRGFEDYLDRGAGFLKRGGLEIINVASEQAGTIMNV